MIRHRERLHRENEEKDLLNISSLRQDIVLKELWDNEADSAYA